MARVETLSYRSPRGVVHTARRYCAIGEKPLWTISSFIEKRNTLWKNRLRSFPDLQLLCPSLLCGEA